MKYIIKLSIFSLLALLFIGCDSDDDQAIAVAQEAPVLISPEAGAAVILDPENSTNPALTVVWNHAGFDIDTQINYQIEVAKAGTDFSTPILAGSTSNRFITWTVKELNDVSAEAELMPFEQGNLDIRIKAGIGSDNVMEMISNIVTVSVTPYTTEAPKLFVIGNFLNASGYGDDWTPSSSLPTIEAPEFGATTFQGYVFLNNPSPEFKILPTNSSFEGDYGDEDASGSSGILIQEGESNMRVSEPGYYKIDADFTDTDNITWSARKQVWGIIGAATPTGWDSDTDLTYDPASKTWSIVIDLTVGEFKFRANDNWDDPQDNLGASSEDGQLEFNGGNLSVDAAGSFLITLDLSNPNNYTYNLTPQ